MARPKSTLDRDLNSAFNDSRKSLRAIARRAGDHEAEDVVQEAFLRILERSQGQKVRKVDNLLSHIVRCISIDRVRQRDRRAKRAVLGGNEVGEGPVNLAANPERTLMGVQRLKRVMAAIDAMSPRQREVFLLHRVEELTYPQIARQIGVSVKAVEKHMSLAIRQLSDVDD